MYLHSTYFPIQLQNKLSTHQSPAQSSCTSDSSRTGQLIKGWDRTPSEAWTIQPALASLRSIMTKRGELTTLSTVVISADVMRKRVFPRWRGQTLVYEQPHQAQLKKIQLCILLSRGWYRVAKKSRPNFNTREWLSLLHLQTHVLYCIILYLQLRAIHIQNEWRLMLRVRIRGCYSNHS